MFPRRGRRLCKEDVGWIMGVDLQENVGGTESRPE